MCESNKATDRPTVPLSLRAERNETAAKVQQERNQGHLGAQAAGRLNARNAIYEKVMRLRREADELEILASALPMVLPYDADEALWKLVQKS